jgi:hypothetical protein
MIEQTGRPGARSVQGAGIPRASAEYKCVCPHTMPGINSLPFS